MKKSKYTIVNSFLFILLILLTNTSYSQSKKEQIETLNKRIDSLIQVVESERLINIEKTNEIIKTTTKLSSLKDNIDLLNNDVSKLNSDLQKSNSELIVLKQELDIRQKIINDLQTQIIHKTDSLNVIKSNLETHKANVSKKFVVDSRELKVGDTINFEDPEKYRWEQIDMSTHYVLYKTPDGWEVQIGSSGDRYLKIETITPP
jgi:chromosome segregation ATPase